MEGLRVLLRQRGIYPCHLRGHHSLLRKSIRMVFCRSLARVGRVWSYSQLPFWQKYCLILKHINPFIITY